MATSTKFIFVITDYCFSIINAPPSDHVGVVTYVNFPQFSTMGVVTKIQEYSQDIESALMASKLPYSTYHIEFTKNDDGTLGATGRYVGIMDVPLDLKELFHSTAFSHAQFVLGLYSLSFDEKCALILNSPVKRPGGSIFRLREKEENEMCVICQQEYEVDDGIHLLLACNHNYHSRCLETWLVKKKKDACPICRTPVSSIDRRLSVRNKSVRKKSKRRQNKKIYDKI